MIKSRQCRVWGQRKAIGASAACVASCSAEWRLQNVPLGEGGVLAEAVVTEPIPTVVSVGSQVRIDRMAVAPGRADRHGHVHQRFERTLRGPHRGRALAGPETDPLDAERDSAGPSGLGWPGWKAIVGSVRNDAPTRRTAWTARRLVSGSPSPPATSLRQVNETATEQLVRTAAQTRAARSSLVERNPLAVSRWRRLPCPRGSGSSTRPWVRHRRPAGRRSERTPAAAGRERTAYGTSSTWLTDTMSMMRGT